MPARGFAARPYSSLLPYRVGGRLGLVGATADAAADLTLAQLRRVSPPPLSFAIAFATPVGEWRPLGRLELGGWLAPERTEALCFDPSNTGGGIELAGLINQLRRPAYRGSQEGRGALRGDAES